MDLLADVWRRTAQSRLRFELGGLAFACQHGFSPEDYARHLWAKGARGWFGKDAPGAGEYLRREAQAVQEFYPGVSFRVVTDSDDQAELVFTDGCLGGSGQNRWGIARSFGLTKRQICRYCGEAFAIWARQLGLSARIGPEGEGGCRLHVTRKTDQQTLS
ncbi:MAG: hypothetical protein HY670_12235 [Chloroflexi bacterium]|nr:hypothetical protein [Chloroflexota bacterium]